MAQHHTHMHSPKDRMHTAYLEVEVRTGLQTAHQQPQGPMDSVPEHQLPRHANQLHLQLPRLQLLRRRQLALEHHVQLQLLELLQCQARGLDRFAQVLVCLCACATESHLTYVDASSPGLHHGYQLLLSPGHALTWLHQAPHHPRALRSLWHLPCAGGDAKCCGEDGRALPLLPRHPHLSPLWSQASHRCHPLHLQHERPRQTREYLLRTIFCFLRPLQSCHHPVLHKHLLAGL
mmetsp:Transcript_3854/g.6484  ORF Transcript_3854/g.6484 Transcript_3854/m.6484 type:complete len:234 (-) Transcript_3854:378-1079(-)